MLFRKDQKQKIRNGELTATFRRWKKAQAKVGGRYNLHPEGAIEVTAVETCSASGLGRSELLAAGYASVDELLDALKCAVDDTIYLVAFRYLGPELVNQPQQTVLDRDQLMELKERLRNMDDRSKRGAWTATFLKLIAKSPGTRAADLADSIDWDTRVFKEHVRRLKKLGLTRSLDVGYELTKRGRQAVDA